MCLNHDLYFFWVSSLAYPNLLGKKGYVVVVVVVVHFYKRKQYHYTQNSTKEVMAL